MPSKKWKNNERQAAALLGGKRLANNGQRQADIDHPLFHIESKERRAVPEWWVKADKALAACPPDKIPMLLFQHAAGQGIPVRRYIILPLGDDRVQEMLAFYTEKQCQANED